MKRKFSFNIAPVKLSPKEKDAALKPTSDPTPSHTHTHRRHYSKDSSISTLDSPFINRRPLDAVTERELRVACAQILRNFKPSDHGLDADPKLDFGGMNRRREPREHKEHKEHRTHPEQVHVRRPTGAPVHVSSTQVTRERSHRTDPSAKHRADDPVRANTGRRRAEHDVSDRKQEVKRAPKTASSEPSRSATGRHETDSEDTKSVGTPMTGSTDNHLLNASTAPTSAAYTSARSSNRISHQFETSAAVADAQAAEWMRQEMEKRRQQTASEAQSEQEQKAPARPPTRARSIRSLFQTSASMSRKQSTDSLRPASNQASSSEPRRSNSSQGWRSWGLQRKSSSRTSSRPGTSKGRIENQDEDKKPELNLNRELPPLPSLDSWKKQEEPVEVKTANAPSAHIANLMRPQDQQQQEYAAAVRRHHRRSGSDTLALKYATSTNTAGPKVARSGSQMNGHSTSTLKRSKPQADKSPDFDEMMAAMDSSHDFNSQLKQQASGHTSHQSSSNISKPKMSMDANHLAAPNFSRKISSEVPRSPMVHDHDGRYQNSVQISGRPEEKEEHKSKLKKAFSGWMLRKNKKDNWMDQMEKNGVKSGIMEQQQAASPPVVRY